MKYYRLSFISLLSCNSDINHDSNDMNITVQATYYTDNSEKEYPDVNSIVYIYYSLDSLFSLKYSYKGHGQYIFNNTVIFPSQIDTINNSGSVIIKPQFYNKTITIGIQIFHYPERVTLHNFLPIASGPILFKQINRP